MLGLSGFGTEGCVLGIKSSGLDFGLGLTVGGLDLFTITSPSTDPFIF